MGERARRAAAVWLTRACLVALIAGGSASMPRVAEPKTREGLAKTSQLAQELKYPS